MGRAGCKVEVLRTVGQRHRRNAERVRDDATVQLVADDEAAPVEGLEQRAGRRQRRSLDGGATGASSSGGPAAGTQLCDDAALAERLGPKLPLFTEEQQRGLLACA